MEKFVHYHDGSIVRVTYGHRGSWGDSIGHTSYDYQAEASMQNRLLVTPTLNKTAVWTENIPGAGGGGGTLNIGYNYYDNAAGDWGGNEYPVRSNSGQSPSVASSFTQDLIFSGSPRYAHSRSTAGMGSWQENQNLSFLGTGFGNSVAANNYVHHVNTEMVSGKMAFTYSRSTDGGSTWDKQGVDNPAQLVNSDWIQNGEYVQGEVALFARGSVVAIVAGGLFNHTFLFKSTDNGDTWNATPIIRLDSSQGRGTMGSLATDYNFDCMFAVAIDGQDQVHVAAAATLMGSTPGTYDAQQYFPFGHTGLYYWNEGMGFNLNLNDPATRNQLHLLSFVDEDGNGIDGTPQDIDSIGEYFTHGPTACPGVAVNDNGYVFLTWTGVKEDLAPFFTFTQGNDNKWGVATDIYSMGSFDNGATWSAPRNVAEEIAGVVGGSWTEEDYFLYTYPIVRGGNVEIIWQSDDYIGYQYNSTNPGPQQSVIMQYSIPVISLGLKEPKNNVDVKLYPNPATEFLVVDMDLKIPAEYDLSIIDQLGRRVTTRTRDFREGSSKVYFDVRDFAPGVYFLMISSEKNALTKKLVIK